MSNEKWLWLAFGAAVIFGALLAGCVLGPSPTPTPTGASKFQFLQYWENESNPYDLAEPYSVYVFCNPSALNISVPKATTSRIAGTTSTKGNNAFNVTLLQEKGLLVDYRMEAWNTTNVTQDYQEEVRQFNHTETNANGTFDVYDSFVDTKQRTVQVSKWTPFNPYGYKFLAGQCLKIRILGRKTIRLGPTAIDHVFSFAGFDFPEYAWWNSSFSNKKAFNVTNVSLTYSNVSWVRVNLSELVTQGKLRLGCPDLRIVNGTETIKQAFEIENNTCQNNVTNATVWFNGTNSANANTTRFFYYNSSLAASENNTPNPWADDSNLIAVWHMSDNMTNGANDSSQYGMTLATLNTGAAPENKTGVWGYGVNVSWLGSDGAGTDKKAYIASNIPAFDPNNTAGNWSISGWIQMKAFGSIGIYLLHRAQTYQGHLAYYLSVQSTGVAIFGGSVKGAPDNCGTTWSVSATAAIPLNEWHYIVGVYNGTHSTIYIDGKFNATTAYSSGLARCSSHAAFRPREASIGCNYFDVAKCGTSSVQGSAFVDEIRVYNRTLEPSEINATWSQNTSAFDAETTPQPPQWSLNQTNTTAAGATANFSVYWTTNANLKNWTFSLDNGNTTFYNFTTSQFTGQANWSNATWPLNSTVGTVVRWRVYSYNDANAINTTDLFQLTTTGVAAGPVVVSLDYPSDGYWNNTANASVNFTFNGSANITYTGGYVKNCSVWENSTGVWQQQWANQSVILNNTRFNITANYTFSWEGPWNIRCFDGMLNASFASSNRTIAFGNANGTAAFGANLSQLNFTPASLTSLAVVPQNVTASNPAFLVNNTGNFTVNYSLKVLTVWTGQNVRCNDQFLDSNATNLTTAYKEISVNAATGVNRSIWCWADYYNPPAPRRWQIYIALTRGGQVAG